MPVIVDVTPFCYVKRCKTSCIMVVLTIPLKCQRLFRPQFRKVNPSFVAQIRQVLDTLMLNVDVSDDTRV